MAIALAGCQRRSVSRTTPAASVVPVGTETAPSPTPGATAPGSGPDLIAAGYHTLLRGLILPVQPSDLIAGAWTGVESEARREGVVSMPVLATLSSDADADLVAFQDAYSALLSSSNGRLDDAILARAALTSMAEAVDDCHTAYLTSGEWDTINADLDGNEFLAGLPLTFQLQSPYLIESVVPGSDADRQGVRPGDSIVSFDGSALDQVPLSQRKFLSAGSAGSTARLDLLTPAGQRRTVMVARLLVDRPVVVTRLIGDVGYIRIRTFTANLGPMLDTAISTLQSQGAKGFVIDLRGNLGGVVDSDVHLLSKFIPSGLLATTSERNGRMDQISADGTALPGPPPLAVLVDGGSLSASELFAEAIQQFHAGELVGTPTPGCLLGSTFRDLSDGSSMQVTVETVDVGPQRVVVNGVGVQPDATVPLSAADLMAGRDPQLDRAVADVEAQLSP
jgi:carboxyl-terminal processing protease